MTSVSSEEGSCGSPGAAAEDCDVDSIDSGSADKLQGSGSRHWLADLLFGDTDQDRAEGRAGQDGLFVDYHFPLGDLELNAGVKWKRPKELCASPQFIVDGATRLDVNQGNLNDCWVLSAIASLSLHRRLLEKVVPLNQSFDHKYSGCFSFRFWQYGQWEEVKVDDLLPTKDGRLIYLSSPEKQEFWSSLLEKAYAKLKGGYRALNMGFPHEAMVDMTGGVAEVMNVAELPRDLSALLSDLLAKGALINCANSKGPLEQKNKFGIMFRHAYSLTGVEKVRTLYGPAVELVRILNPWGNTEWEGPWSDYKGAEWNTVSSEEQQRLQRVRREDGEFWMSVSDFRHNFEVMEVCHLTENLNKSDSTMPPWCCTMHHGSWVSRMSAGGSPIGGVFWQNPQFYFTLLEEDNSPTQPQRSCSFLVALMQKHQRRRGVNLAIGLHIYKTRPGSKFLSPADLSMHRPVLNTPRYSRSREVVIRADLAPGHYIIIPSTSEPNQEGEFLIRILTERGDAAVPVVKPPPPQDITSINEQPSLAHLTALPSPQSTKRLFRKHCNKEGFCKPADLHGLLTEAIQGGVLAGTEKKLVLEHCKSFVVLMDRQGQAKLSWQDFKHLWDKISRWTDIFLLMDKNRSQHLEYPEVSPALKAAGITVDDFVLELVGLRYTEPDMTISYPGFLFLLMKLDTMIHRFQTYDMVGMGAITVTYRQWLQMTMFN